MVAIMQKPILVLTIKCLVFKAITKLGVCNVIKYLTWISIKIPSTTMTVTSLATNGNYIFAGTANTTNGNGGDGVFLSNNNGTSWSQVGFANSYITSLTNCNNNIFVGVWGDGIFLTTNNGVSWNNINDGLTFFPNIYPISFGKNGNYIFTGFWGGGVWKRPLSDFVGITENNQNNMLSIYTKPATSILTINLKQQTNLQNTTISIYDIQGKLLLHQAISNAQTELNIAQFAKGMYIVKVKNENDNLVSKFTKE